MGMSAASPNTPKPALLTRYDGSSPRAAKLVGERRDAFRRREIGGDDHRPGVAGGGDLLRQRLERRFAPRGQHQRVAVAGEFAGERGADAGGGAGDEADGLNG